VKIISFWSRLNVTMLQCLNVLFFFIEALEHYSIEAFFKRGKRGGGTWRRRCEIYETTPDASGNVWNELPTKFATKPYVETLHATSAQPTKPIPYIAAGSGETTESKKILAVPSIKLKAG